MLIRSNKYIFRLCLFLIVVAPSVLLLIAHKVLTPKDNSAVFLNLMERCRHSIETSTEFDSQGLEHINTKTKIFKSKQQSEDVIWSAPNSPYNVYVKSPKPNSETLHRCDVYLADGHHMNANQQAMVIREFMILREKLASEQTHEFKNISLKYPSIMLAFAPIEKNKRGCDVISTFVLNITGDSFRTSTGEIVRSCATNSR